jgi:hypothetical protein
MYWKSILTRGFRRLWLGVPATLIAVPFDRVQATRVLTAVLDRGTVEELTTIFLALGKLGYTACPSSGNPSCWQLVPVEPLHIEGQAPLMVVQPTLVDVQTLAADLEFDVRGDEHDETFALHKRSDRSVGGTWSNTQAGLRDAYDYLVRYRLTLENSDQARGRP